MFTAIGLSDAVVVQAATASGNRLINITRASDTPERPV
ncbi:hypothetical protein CEV32_2442 [Brucella rhizosphaerae]|uniref:Uncharacterized protein n=1 Tax=Brucella rhizosphaerae TaxID=571254 RepID=A0A256F576_9HYPH|nr:hypothetical protein CEV32_2442 [Brucella rhizosphaerae]